MSSHSYAFSDPSCAFEVRRGVRYLDEMSGEFLEMDVVTPIRNYWELGTVFLPPGFTDQQISVVLNRASQAYMGGRGSMISEFARQKFSNRLRRRWRAFVEHCFDFWSP